MARFRLSTVKNYGRACPCRWLPVIVFLVASPLMASDDPFQEVVSKYGPEFLAEAIVRNTVTINSKDGISDIPAVELYHTALLRIILNASVTQQSFNQSDWDLIINLPAHNDRRFSLPHYHLLRSTCDQTKSIVRDGSVRSAESVASIFSSGEQSIQDDLLLHYENFMASLSDHGRARVDQEVSELASVSNMVHTTMDLAGLSRETPEYVQLVIDQACHRLETLPEPDPQEILLRDVPLGWERTVN